MFYAAAWEGEPLRVFADEVTGDGMRPLGPVGAGILAASPAGGAAVTLNRRFLRGYVSVGTLALLENDGDEARPLVEGAQWADLSPDGKDLLVVRDVGGRNRIEYPVGRVLYETGGWVSHARLSPGGDGVAFFDHPIPADDGGAVCVVDAGGRKRTLSDGWVSAQGLA